MYIYIHITAEISKKHVVSMLSDYHIYIYRYIYNIYIYIYKIYIYKVFKEKTKQIFIENVTAAAFITSLL